VPERPAIGPPDGRAVLTCRSVDLAYGSLRVVEGLDLDVRRGELLALLGTNGAGKSTVLRGLVGLLPPSAGTVTLDGVEVQGEPTEALARRGIGLMAGGHAVFPTLSVAENLRMAAWMFRHDRARVAARLATVEARFPVLAARRHQRAGDLSGGEQQMLGLAGTLLGEPEVLLIDELSLGLAPTVVNELLGVVADVHAAGTTVVVVEQSVHVALELAERAVFLERGAIRFDGPTTDLLDRPDLLRSVFIEGNSVEAAPKGRARRRPAAGATGGAHPVLECVGLVKQFGGLRALDDIDLQIHPGEIVGLIGHNGAGKTTLLDVISGFLPADSGIVRLDGRDLDGVPAAGRARLGLGRSFQDPRLFPSLTVAEAIAVARERHVTSRSVLADGLALPASYESELAVDGKVDELLDLLGLRSLRTQLTGELSTGTRRIVDLACVLAHEPTVLLLDEPSSGVAQSETEALGELLRRVRTELGCAVAIVEHDMPLIRGLADRLVALELGAVVATGRPDDVLAHPRVIESYLGTAVPT
jgi:branched-chain amino acid transport system ATP-binding protein